MKTILIAALTLTAYWHPSACHDSPDPTTQVALLLPLFDTGHGMKPTETPKESA